MPKKDFVLRKEVDSFFRHVSMLLIEGVLVFNNDEQCIFLNQAAASVLGPELLNKKMRIIFPSQLFEKNLTQLDVEMKSRNGNTFTAFCTSYFFKLEEQKWTIVIFYNKTEAYEKRSYVERVANDFGNKLAGIIGSVELLLPKFESGSFEKGRLENIKVLAENANQLLIKLLEFLPKEERSFKE